MSDININVKVNQGSSAARLKHLSGQVEKVGRATADTARDFKNFNRTIFGATAFVGIFTQAFSGLASAMMAGSELDRASQQFGNRFGKELPEKLQEFGDGAEAVVGPSGRFIQMIRGMTDNSIDMMSAMQASIRLKSAGVTGDISQMAEIVAMAGTAAKMAGKDSAEGIKRVTDFLKDGSLAHLQHLGLLRTVNPELKAQLSILNASAGVMGTAVTSTFKLALGMKILRDATRGQLKGQRDLRDTLQDTAQFFDILKRTVGTFLGTAMQPLLETFIDFAANASYVLEDIKNNKKEILFLAKAFMIGTAAVSAFVLVVGGLRLAVTALTSLVGGIPFLTIGFTALAAAVILNKTSLKGLVEGFRTFGQVAQGSFQLISSFMTDADNFSEGVGYMDKSLHNMLKKKGLLTLTQNIARAGSIVWNFARGAANGFTSSLEAMLDKLGSVGKRIKDFLGLDNGVWTRKWLDTAKVLGEAFGKMAAGALALWGVMKLLKGGKAILGGLNFAGKFTKFFGGSKDKASVEKNKKPGKNTTAGLLKGGPNGSKTNPFYVITVTDFLNSNQKNVYAQMRKQGKSPTAAIAAARSIPIGRQLAVTAATSAASSGATTAATKGGMLSKLFGGLATAIKPVISFFGKFAPFVSRMLMGLGRFTLVGTIIATVGTFLYGFVEGLLEAKAGIDIFVNSIGTWVSNLFETNPFLSKIKTGFEFLYNGIADIFEKIREWGQSLGKNMGDALGRVGQAAHNDNAKKWLGEVSTMHHNMGESLLPDGYAKQANGAGPRSPMIPAMPSYDIEAGVMIKQALSVLKGDDQLRMQKAFENAISSGSAGGLTITPEEWITIFSLGMDKSKKIGQIADDGKDTKKNTGGTTVKSTRTGVC